MRKTTLLLASLLACSFEEQSDGRCVFDGRYEIGVDWSDPSFVPECGVFARSFTFNRVEDECASVNADVGIDGQVYQLIATCEEGDPVVECTGYFDRLDCSWPIYIRRIEQ